MHTAATTSEYHPLVVSEPRPEPSRQLLAAVIFQAIADLRDPRYRKSAVVWMLDAAGTCPAYCAALDIPYRQFVAGAQRLVHSVRARAPRKVKPTKRGGLRKSQRIAAHGARA